MLPSCDATSAYAPSVWSNAIQVMPDCALQSNVSPPCNCSAVALQSLRAYTTIAMQQNGLPATQAQSLGTGAQLVHSSGQGALAVQKLPTHARIFDAILAIA